MTEMPQTRENQVSHQDIFDVPKITLERKLALWWQAGIRQSRARVVLRDCIGVAFLVASTQWLRRAGGEIVIEVSYTRALQSIVLHSDTWQCQ
jgi:hypothetical protein